MKSRAFAVALSPVFAVATLAVFAGEPAHHWSYKGSTGPAHWSGMEKEFESCGLGKVQSPIDIHTKQARVAGLPEIVFDYKPSALEIVDNGHTVQVDYAPGSFMQVGDARYELVQFHFHHPSEEKVDGHSYDMVAHLVHEGADGKLAVVAVPIVKGKENPLVATLWKNLPHEKEREKTVDGVMIDASDLLPAAHAYYTFEGSLTTPPCSEGVRWFVLKKPATLSPQEITAFAKIYPMNARPVQPVNGREVLMTK
jgi:carbonic anhydrase